MKDQRLLQHQQAVLLKHFKKVVKCKILLLNLRCSGKFESFFPFSGNNCLDTENDSDRVSSTGVCNLNSNDIPKQESRELLDGSFSDHDALQQPDCPRRIQIRSLEETGQDLKSSTELNLNSNAIPTQESRELLDGSISDQDALQQPDCPESIQISSLEETGQDLKSSTEFNLNSNAIPTQESRELLNDSISVQGALQQPDCPESIQISSLEEPSQVQSPKSTVIESHIEPFPPLLKEAEKEISKLSKIKLISSNSDNQQNIKVESNLSQIDSLSDDEKAKELILRSTTNSDSR